MPQIHLPYVQDAATLGYLQRNFERIDAEVNRNVYPEIIYPQLVPVDSSGDQWTQTVRYFSHTEYGAANWINGNADDVPMAGIGRSSNVVGVHMAAIGYGWGFEEINIAQRMGVDLQSEEAAAARLAAEQMIQRVALNGDATKGFTGVFNATGVSTSTAQYDWEDYANVTNAQVISEFNTLLMMIPNQTNQSTMANTVILPLSDWNALAQRTVASATGGSIDFVSGNLLSYLMTNNIYTATTGQRIQIRADASLETAGAGGTKRKVVYRRDPQVLKMYVPMPHQFLGVFQPGPLRFEVPGVFRLGGVNVKRPQEMHYRDGDGA